MIIVKRLERTMQSTPHVKKSPQCNVWGFIGCICLTLCKKPVSAQIVISSDIFSTRRHRSHCDTIEERKTSNV